MSTTTQHHIGRTELINIVDYGLERVPAKIDTGAYSSSIWASDINVNENKDLNFVLFGPTSPFYSGQTITTSDYKETKVRSSFGHRQKRYAVTLDVQIAGQTVKGRFTLANRSKNRYPVLIGRLTIKNKFLIDVSRSNAPFRKVIKKRDALIKLIHKDIEHDKGRKSK